MIILECMIIVFIKNWRWRCRTLSNGACDCASYWNSTNNTFRAAYGTTCAASCIHGSILNVNTGVLDSLRWYNYSWMHWQEQAVVIHI